MIYVRLTQQRLDRESIEFQHVPVISRRQLSFFWRVISWALLVSLRILIYHRHYFTHLASDVKVSFARATCSSPDVPAQSGIRYQRL